MEEKSLRLLADPNKLKEQRKLVLGYNRFKNQLECEFNCDITDKLYQRLYKMIEREIMIHSVLSDIIDQAIQYHNP
mgnify:CR=1 FL=1